jgi:hypothetical protein
VLFFAGASLLLLAGCTSYKSVSGSVAIPEKYKIGAKDTVQIQFIPQEKGARASFGTFEHDGSFTCDELTPGK